MPNNDDEANCPLAQSTALFLLLIIKIVQRNCTNTDRQPFTIKTINI